MNTLHVLGAHGGRSNNGMATTCLQLSKECVIDAGNILEVLGDEAIHIDHIFFTHSHLDHLIDSAFIVDNFFAKRTKPLCFYGLPKTLEAIKKHLFNWEIWPDFSSLQLVQTEAPAVKFIPINPDESITIGHLTLTPILANHTVPCCGYEIKVDNSAIFFTSDTTDHEGLWNYLNNALHVKALIADVSFPNRLEDIAIKSKHFSPNLFGRAMKKLTRNDLDVYTYHLKPSYAIEVTKELNAIGISSDKILQGGEKIDYATGKIVSKTTPKEEKIATLNRIGTALSAQQNLDELLEMIIEEAKHLTNADGGTLYLLRDNQLHFKVAQTDSLGIKMGGLSGPITWPSLPLYTEDGAKNTSMVAAMCALKKEVISIPDVYEAQGFNFEGTRKFDASTGYRSKSMLVVPLKDYEGAIIGVVQLLNKQANGQSVAFSKEDEELLLSLGSQAAVAISNTTLIHDLEVLLESFLKSIIYAIRKKSPYTAGHIERMVDITLMIAEGINKDSEFFKNKSFGIDELKQMTFAALMHDIGKLATPEYIVDKSTKLEGISDGIKLIEARLETIKLAIENALLKGEISNAQAKEKIKYLEETYAMLARTNKGAEFVPDEEVAKIQEIASKPFIVGQREFTLLLPHEAYHLSVQKGTLTTEEREIINDHASITIEILNKLPFPAKYQEIPQISGNHHEKINGKGYPQGLKGDEISFEARILAVADIFEALTASDRPYKKANPLSMAMKILYFMAKDEELDKDIVRFFYESGLYKEYAKKHLPPESIDEVSVDFSGL